MYKAKAERMEEKKLWILHMEMLKLLKEKQ